MSIESINRQETIKKLLNSNAKVKTIDLVKQFNVSSETIRRDFEEMEEKNILKRVWGGAIKISYSESEPDIFKRNILQTEEKKLIGQIASKLINENDVIIIDEGTTNLHLVNNLINFNKLTIITCSIPILNALVHLAKEFSKSFEIIFLGGYLDINHLRFNGVLTQSIMSSFYADIAFISTVGISIDFGVSEHDIKKGMLSQQFIRQAKSSVIMCDHTKINVRSNYKCSDLREIDIIVSNNPAPDDWSDHLSVMGINWITADYKEKKND